MSICSLRYDYYKENLYFQLEVIDSTKYMKNLGGTALQ